MNAEQKARIIQLLYDLNDVNFDLIGKNNFELDIGWPSIQLLNAKSAHNQQRARRTSSVSSYVSHVNNMTHDKDMVILSQNH